MRATIRAGVIFMDKLLFIIGLAGLVLSCGAVEQADYERPEKPNRQEMAERLANTNSLFWDHGAR